MFHMAFFLNWYSIFWQEESLKYHFRLNKTTLCISSKYFKTLKTSVTNFSRRYDVISLISPMQLLPLGENQSAQCG